MSTIMRDEIRTARKDYMCDSFARWRDCSMGEHDCEDDAQRAALKEAEDAGGKIRAGEKYRYLSGIYDGDFFVWRARPAMDKLCAAHGLYDEY